jgi:hypothetical protein
MEDGFVDRFRKVFGVSRFTLIFFSSLELCETSLAVGFGFDFNTRVEGKKMFGLAEYVLQSISMTIQALKQNGGNYRTPFQL